MSDVDGTWHCVVNAPMGEQQFVLTVRSAGAGFTGRAEGSLGAIEIEEGEVAGATLKWPMRVKKPLPLTLNCEATVDGDTLAGEVSAGLFGSFAIRGTRG